MPICTAFVNDGVISRFILSARTSVLLAFRDGGVAAFTEKGEKKLPAGVAARAQSVLTYMLSARGALDGDGRHVIDLKAPIVGPHYNVNLLLGDRASYADPLMTTPKSAVDAFGRGSFRAGGATQVLATRYVLDPSENGEPVNRQFYLVEKGKQIFYSADAHTNVAAARCVHAQNRTTITYCTRCGLTVERTIFILPQEEGLPEAVEVQRVCVQNDGDKTRILKIVMTGAFGICAPDTIVNDVIYANAVHQTELLIGADGPVALGLHNKNSALAGEKKFALLLSDGEGMDDHCASLSEFIGTGTLARPDTLAVLPSRPGLKTASFFALGKAFTLVPGARRVVDQFVGYCEALPGEESPAPWARVQRLIERYACPHGLEATLSRVIADRDQYAAYLTLSTDDPRFNVYVGRNLPFQVLYQTFVSRSFAWTQKAFRETGFREIQDIYASMNYLIAEGKASLVRALIAVWACNVFRMGYAYHDFIRRGKNPGDCSDDQLWLVQAVYRYVSQTGDYSFLDERLSVAGEPAAERSLWETLEAILVYSGKISVGAHGLPLLDKADWNDTLRLDKTVYEGPKKEALYREQLALKGQPYGTAWENTLTESVMNACLLKIAADQTTALAAACGRADTEALARGIAVAVYESVQQNAWKADFFARTLINDGREGGYTYLGARGDKLSVSPGDGGTYFLNSYSWSILADIANEAQIEVMLGVVEKNLKCAAGLKLCTLVDYPRLGTDTATGLYYPGDRENGGVFKHAAMMAATASLKAAKTVKSEALARRLVALAAYAIEKTLPYKTLDNPFVLKGNPRFCTQYNNSETGENVGPILSGTASWLTLAVYELLGITESATAVSFNPVLLSWLPSLRFSLESGGTRMTVSVEGPRFRAGRDTTVTVDGVLQAAAVVPKDGKTHCVRIVL
ncbi:MAG: glycosyl transferase [Clostridiales bacterium]|nr:glycosyl transferase [Clostridiales bacterium]